MAHSTFTLSGKHTSPSGTAHVGSVKVTPNAVIRDVAGAVVMAGPDVVKLDASGAWSLVLPCDSPGLNPATGIGFTVEYLFRAESLEPQSFYATADLAGSTVDAAGLVTTTVARAVTTTIGPQIGTATDGTPYLLPGDPASAPASQRIVTDSRLYPGALNVRAATLPAGLGWAADALMPELYAGGVVGDVGITPQALFDRYSTARSAPAQTFWVSTSGNDANAGTQAAPFRGLQKAIQAANAAGTPTLINVVGTPQATVFERSRSFHSASVYPTVDVAIVAVGGRVNTGTFDLLTPAADATFTSTYSAAVANCDRVCDTANLNRFGNYGELVQVDSAAKCDKIPGTWALVAGTLYIHRADEKAPTPTNTRVYRNQAFTLLAQTPINVYIEGIDLEGGAAGGGVARFDMQAAGLTAPPKAVVLNSCSFKYGGGSLGTTSTGVAVSSWNGLVAAFNCQADANAVDGFNFHNAQGVAQPMSLTVNCSAKDNGRGGAASCQGLTYHENCVGVDVAGYYEGNRGGNVRNINASKLYLLGTVLKDDRGDGISMPPTGIRVDDNATAWCERTLVEQPRGQNAYATGSSTAAIYRRDCAPVPQPDSGPGLFGTF